MGARPASKSTYHHLSVISIREANADGLVQENHVRVRVPRVRVEFRAVRTFDVARAYVRELKMIHSLFE